MCDNMFCRNFPGYKNSFRELFLNPTSNNPVLRGNESQFCMDLNTTMFNGACFQVCVHWLLLQEQYITSNKCMSYTKQWSYSWYGICKFIDWFLINFFTISRLKIFYKLISAPWSRDIEVLVIETISSRRKWRGFSSLTYRYMCTFPAATYNLFRTLVFHSI